MVFMIKKRTKLISVLVAGLMVLGIFSGMIVSSSAASPKAEASENEYGLLDDVHGSLILHCWCWNFNTIKDNMETIAKAGYSAVQTSPINKVYEGDGGGLKIKGEDADGKWYYHYQPTAYTIGNYQLGTEAEFKAMCEEAHKYGVKVIVDVVANHTSPTKSAVSKELLNIEGGLYHSYVPSGKTDRKSTTQWYNGLPDVNTQNKNYQNVILKYLKQCVADGADGFRYDTAKHIELPDDDPEYASNFWPTVLENGSSFQYGEVLQGYDGAEITAARYADYSKIMNITASSYGAKLRTYLMKFDYSPRSLSDYSSEGVTADKLVTWIESHDTYANGGLSNNAGTSFWLNNNQIKKGWALIAARGTTSLFFNRPDGSSTEDLWGKNLIGPKGDDNFIDPEVVAVNHFHNSMDGESEAMTSGGSKKIVVITRGTKGAVIVNSDVTKDYNVNVATTLLDGTYTDTAHNTEFIVKDGKLTGTVKADTVVVMDNLDSSHYTSEIVEPTTVEPTTTPVQPETKPVVVKKANPVKVTVAKKTVKASKLKKKAQTVKKAFKVTKAQGTVKVSKVKSGTTSKIYKKITVKKNGNITIKKGKYAKKTYKIKIKVVAKGNANYKSKTVNKTVKLKIK
jgi:alpha-amylase